MENWRSDLGLGDRRFKFCSGPLQARHPNRLSFRYGPLSQGLTLPPEGKSQRKASKHSGKTKRLPVSAFRFLLLPATRLVSYLLASEANKVFDSGME